MTADRALKQRVRARARRTGESYTAALRHFRSPGGETVPTTDHSPARLRLAVAQTTFRTDPGDARAFQEAGAEVRRLMRDAHAAGADVLQLPEATLCFPDKWSLSRERDRLTEADWSRFDWASAESAVEEIRATARSLRLWTVLGAQQRHPSDPAARPSSSLLVIDPGGTVSARYDERLLSRSKQAYLYAAGAAGVVIDVHGVRLGLASGLEALFPRSSVTTRARTSTASCSPPPGRGTRPRRTPWRRRCVPTPCRTVSGSVTRCRATRLRTRRPASSHPAERGRPGARAG